jgi:hypothetical protein
MADLADHAYGHALAVLGDAAAAAAAARRGLGRGGRSRLAVLGHTRAAALAGVEPGPVARPAMASVADVAVALAARRPPVERAVADLDGTRHGLTRGGFARAVGLSPAAAGERAASVASAWAAELDPALLAWLGPGDCAELAAVLGGVDPADPDALLGLAGAVSGHAEACQACGDRLRAMVSVRSLLGQLPLPEAPAELRAAARAARRRPPVPPPALGEQRSGLWVGAALSAAVVLFMAAAVFGAVHVVQSRGRSRDDRVAALTALPSGRQSLAVSSSTFDATTHSLVLTNRSDGSLRWQAAATVPWVSVTPAEGVLAPGASQPVSVRLSAAAPEGEIDASLTFTGADGSTAAVTGTGTIERAPDVAAHRQGCEVFATAEDEGRVAAVVVHWRTGGPASAESSDGMQSVEGGGYHDALPPNATSWWVTAADARGNISHTPEEPVTPPAC